MSLEEDIKQEKFSSEYQKLAINIAFTNSFLTNLLNSYLKPYDLSVQQYNVLRILRGQHPSPVSINAITDRMIDKMSNASRLVEKLRKKDMIHRQPCNTDKRQVDVCITTNGLENLSKIDALMGQYEHQFDHLDISEVTMANKVLDDLRKNIND
ncbi:MAG: DNA-binding MarR family transcriptional regulator [Bacteroidia bacterium]|jgi:DNA-binding MarR family transcriptional regulator